eukprot:11780642-Ditylum_brightwellii.AAC.1
MAVTALRLLVRVDGLVDDVVCDEKSHGPAVLFMLMELPQDCEAFDISSDILSLMSPKQIFAEAVSRQGELWRLLKVLERQDEGEKNDPPSSSIQSKEEGEQDADLARQTAKRQERGWAFLESLVSTPAVANAIVNSSGWLELLGILVGYSGFTKLWAGRQ